MGVVVATITSGGKTLDLGVDLLSIEVRKELDRVPEARLAVIDGSVAAREFALSNGEFFAPGAEIRVELHHDDDPAERVFAGLVVRHAVEARADNSELRVELRDVAVAMTRRRNSAVHRDRRDDDVIRELVEHAGLKVGGIDEMSVEHGELIQYYASDWDFMLSRADVNGMVVIVDDGVLSVRAMAGDAETRARFEYGLDEIHEVELELDGGGQWSSVTGAAWDLGQQALTQPAEAEQLDIAAGNLAVKDLADKVGGESLALLSSAALAPAELEPWASARLARSRLALLRGRLVVPGRADIKPFDRVELGGVGERFNGKLLVSGVIQRFDHDGWRTELQIGLAPEWYARTPEIADVPAAGLLPPVTGLQIGVIDAFESDPLGERRVRVRLPALATKEDAVWARLARPDAGKDRGFAFWPEAGDEVIVGFVAGDPRQAVVLGALYGSVNTPPAAGEGPSDGNAKRALVSRSGTTIAFDDDKPSLTIKTPKDNTIVVDDDAGSVTIRDQHGNSITMDANGMKFSSASDLAFEARGKVTIKGASVDVQ